MNKLRQVMNYDYVCSATYIEGKINEAVWVFLAILFP